MNEPRSLKATDLRIGLKADFERDITAEDVALFADLSGDHNPLHLDESYAVQTNYGARIVHGAFQVALASTMAGMYLPGRSVVVGSYQSRFPVPLLYPSRVRVTGKITAWSSESGTGILRVQIIDLSDRAVTADIHVAFSLHEKRLQPASDAQQVVVSSTGKPVVIVTGAGGGIGGRLVSRLAADYQVLGIVRSLPDTKEISPNHWVKWVCTDLTSPHWEEALDSELGDQESLRDRSCSLARRSKRRPSRSRLGYRRQAGGVRFSNDYPNCPVSERESCRMRTARGAGNNGRYTQTYSEILGIFTWESGARTRSSPARARTGSQ